jgi:hypothetical protein
MKPQFWQFISMRTQGMVAWNASARVVFTWDSTTSGVISSVRIGTSFNDGRGAGSGDNHGFFHRGPPIHLDGDLGGLIRGEFDPPGFDGEEVLGSGGEQNGTGGEIGEAEPARHVGCGG